MFEVFDKWIPIHPSGTGSDVQVPKHHLKWKLEKPPDNDTSKGDLHLTEGSSPKRTKLSNSYSTTTMTSSSSKAIETSEETKGNLEAFDQNNYAKDNAQAATNTNSLNKSKEEGLERADKSTSHLLPGDAGSSENTRCLDAMVADEIPGAANANVKGDFSLTCGAAGSFEKQVAKTEDGQLDNNHYKCSSKTKHRVDMLSHEGHKDKPKKKRHKDTKFEGERIPHLVKQKQYRRENSEEKEEDSKKNDDYVLEKLFKKSGNLLGCSVVSDYSNRGT